MKKKFLSLLLTIVTLTTSIPMGSLTAHADGPTPSIPEVELNIPLPQGDGWETFEDEYYQSFTFQRFLWEKILSPKSGTDEIYRSLSQKIWSSGLEIEVSPDKSYVTVDGRLKVNLVKTYQTPRIIFSKSKKTEDPNGRGGIWIKYAVEPLNQLKATNEYSRSNQKNMYYQISNKMIADISGEAVVAELPPSSGSDAESIVLKNTGFSNLVTYKDFLERVELIASLNNYEIVWGTKNGYSNQVVRGTGLAELVPFAPGDVIDFRKQQEGFGFSNDDIYFMTDTWISEGGASPFFETKFGISFEKAGALDYEYFEYTNLEGQKLRVYRSQVPDMAKNNSNAGISIYNSLAEKQQGKAPVETVRYNNSKALGRSTYSYLEKNANKNGKYVEYSRVPDLLDLSFSKLKSLKEINSSQSTIDPAMEHYAIKTIEDFTRVKNFVLAIEFFSKDGLSLGKFEKKNDDYVLGLFEENDLITLKNSTLYHKSPNVTFNFQPLNFERTDIFPDNYSKRTSLGSRPLIPYTDSSTESKEYDGRIFSIVVPKFSKFMIRTGNLNLSVGSKDIFEINVPQNQQEVEIMPLIFNDPQIKMGIGRIKVFFSGERLVNSIRVEKKEGSEYRLFGIQEKVYSTNYTNDLEYGQLNLTPEYQALVDASPNEKLNRFTKGQYRVTLISNQYGEYSFEFKVGSNEEVYRGNISVDGSNNPSYRLNSDGYYIIEGQYSGSKYYSYSYDFGLGSHKPSSYISLTNKSSKPNSDIMSMNARIFDEKLPQINGAFNTNESIYSVDWNRRYTKSNRFFRKYYKNSENDFNQISLDRIFVFGTENDYSKVFAFDNLLAYLRIEAAKENLLISLPKGFDRYNKNSDNVRIFEYYDLINPSSVQEDSSIVINPVLKRVYGNQKISPFIKPSALLVPVSEINAIDFDYMYFSDSRGINYVMAKKDVANYTVTDNGQSYILLNSGRSTFKTKEEFRDHISHDYEFVFVKDGNAKKVSKTLQDTDLNSVEPATVAANSEKHLSGTLFSFYYSNPVYADRVYSFTMASKNQYENSIYDKEIVYYPVFDLPTQVNIGEINGWDLVKNAPKTYSYSKTLKIENFSNNELDFRPYLKSQTVSLRLLNPVIFSVTKTRLKFFIEKEVSGQFVRYPDEQASWDKDYDTRTTAYSMTNLEPGKYRINVMNSEGKYVQKEFTVDYSGDKKTNGDLVFDPITMLSNALIFEEKIELPNFGHYVSSNIIESTNHYKIILKYDFSEFSGLYLNSSSRLYLNSGNFPFLGKDMFLDPAGSTDIDLAELRTEQLLNEITDVVYVRKDSESIKDNQIEISLAKINASRSSRGFSRFAFKTESGEVVEKMKIALPTSGEFVEQKIKLVATGNSFIKIIKDPAKTTIRNSNDPYSYRGLMFVVSKGIQLPDGSWKYIPYISDTDYTQFTSIPREDNLKITIVGNGSGSSYSKFIKESIKFEQDGQLQDFYLIKDSSNIDTIDLRGKIKIHLTSLYLTSERPSYSYREGLPLYKAMIYKKNKAVAGGWELVEDVRPRKGHPYDTSKKIIHQEGNFFKLPLGQPMVLGEHYKVVMDFGNWTQDAYLNFESIYQFSLLPYNHSQYSKILQNYFILSMVEPSGSSPEENWTTKKLKELGHEGLSLYGNAHTYQILFEPMLKEVNDDEKVIRISIGSGDYGSWKYKKTIETPMMISMDGLKMIGLGYDENERPLGRDGAAEGFSFSPNRESAYFSQVYKVTQEDLRLGNKFKFSTARLNSLSNANYGEDNVGKYYAVVFKNAENKYSSVATVEIPQDKRRVYKNFAEDNEILVMSSREFQLKQNKQGKNSLEGLKVFVKYQDNGQQKEVQVYDLATDFYNPERGVASTGFTPDVTRIKVPISRVGQRDQFKIVYTWNGSQEEIGYDDIKPDTLGIDRDPKNFDLSDLKVNPDWKYEFKEEGLSINDAKPVPYPADGIVKITDVKDADERIREISPLKFIVRNASVLNEIKFEIKEPTKQFFALTDEEANNVFIDNSYRGFGIMEEADTPAHKAYKMAFLYGDDISDTTTKVTTNIPFRMYNKAERVLSPETPSLKVETNYPLWIQHRPSTENSAIEVSSTEPTSLFINHVQSQTTGTIILKDLKLKKIRHDSGGQYSSTQYKIQNVLLKSDEKSSSTNSIVGRLLSSENFVIDMPHQKVELKFGGNPERRETLPNGLTGSWIENITVLNAREFDLGNNGNMNVEKVALRNINVHANVAKVNSNEGRYMENVNITTHNYTFDNGNVQKGLLVLESYPGGTTEPLTIKDSKMTTLLHQTTYAKDFRLVNSSFLAEETTMRSSAAKIIVNSDSFFTLERNRSREGLSEDEIQNYDSFEKEIIPKNEDNQNLFLYRIPTSYQNIRIEGYGNYDFTKAQPMNGNYNIWVPFKRVMTLHYTENGVPKEKRILPELDFDINNLVVVRLTENYKNEIRVSELNGLFSSADKYKNGNLDAELQKLKDEKENVYVYIADRNASMKEGKYAVTRKTLEDLLDIGFTLEADKAAGIIRFTSPVGGKVFDQALFDDTTQVFDYNSIQSISHNLHIADPYEVTDDPLTAFRSKRFSHLADSSRRTAGNVTYDQILSYQELQFANSKPKFAEYKAEYSLELSDDRKNVFVKVRYPYIKNREVIEGVDRFTESSFQIPVLPRTNTFDIRAISDISWIRNGVVTKHVDIETVPPENLIDNPTLRVRITDLSGNTWTGTLRELSDKMRAELNYSDAVMLYRINNLQSKTGIKENINLAPQGKASFGLYVKPFNSFEAKILDLKRADIVEGFYPKPSFTGDEYISIQDPWGLTLTSFPASVIPNNDSIVQGTVPNYSLLFDLRWKPGTDEALKQNPTESVVDFSGIKFSIIDSTNISAENVDYAFLKAREVSIRFNPENGTLALYNKQGRKISGDYVYIIRDGKFQRTIIKSFEIIDWKRNYNQGDTIDTDQLKFRVVDIDGNVYDADGKGYMTYAEAKERLINFRITPNPETDGKSLQPDVTGFRALFNYYTLGSQFDTKNFQIEKPITVTPVEFDKNLIAGLELIRKPFILMGSIDDGTPMDWSGMIIKMVDTRGAEKTIRFTSTNNENDALFKEYFLETNKPQGSIFRKTSDKDIELQDIEVYSTLDNKLKIYAGNGGNNIQTPIEDMRLVKPPTFVGPYEYFMSLSRGSELDYSGMIVEVKLQGEDGYFRFLNDGVFKAFPQVKKIGYTSDVSFIKEPLPGLKPDELAEAYRDVAWVGVVDSTVEQSDPRYLNAADVKQNGYNKKGFRISAIRKETGEGEKRTDEDFIRDFSTSPIYLNNEIAKKAYKSGLSPYDPIVTYIQNNLPGRVNDIQYINNDAEGNKEIVLKDGTRIKIPAAVLKSKTAKVIIDDIVVKLGETKDILFVAVPTANETEYDVTLQRTDQDGNITFEKLPTSSVTEKEKNFGNQKLRIVGTKIGTLKMTVSLVNNNNDGASKQVNVRVVDNERADVPETKIVRGLTRDLLINNPYGLTLERLRQNTFNVPKIGIQIPDVTKMQVTPESDKNIGRYTIISTNENNLPTKYGDFKDFVIEVLKGQITAENVVVDLDKDAQGKEQTLGLIAVNDATETVIYPFPEHYEAKNITFNKTNPGLFENYKKYEDDFVKAEIKEDKLLVTPKKVTEQDVILKLKLDVRSKIATSEILLKDISVRVKQDKVQQDFAIGNRTVIRGNTDEVNFGVVHDKLKALIPSLIFRTEINLAQKQYQNQDETMLRYKIPNDAPLKTYVVTSNKDEINSEALVLNPDTFNVTVVKYTLDNTEMNVYKDFTRDEMLAATLEDQGGNKIYTAVDKPEYVKDYALLDDTMQEVSELDLPNLKVSIENNLLTVKGKVRSDNNIVNIKIKVSGEKDVKGNQIVDDKAEIVEIVPFKINVLDDTSNKNGVEKRVTIKNYLTNGKTNDFLKTFDREFTYKIEPNEKYDLNLALEDKNDNGKEYLVYEVKQGDESIYLRGNDLQKTLHRQINDDVEISIYHRPTGNIISTGTVGTVFILIGGSVVLLLALSRKKKESKQESGEK